MSKLLNMPAVHFGINNESFRMLSFYLIFMLHKLYPNDLKIHKGSFQKYKTNNCD